MATVAPAGSSMPSTAGMVITPSTLRLSCRWAMAAAPVLLEGKMLEPKAAKAAGLIDEVVAPDQLLARAREWVLSATDADIVKPWDQKGWKMPGGAPYHPAGFMTFVGANAMVHGKTQGVYPAAKALLSAVYEGALVPFDTAPTLAGSPRSS